MEVLVRFSGGYRYRTRSPGLEKICCRMGSLPVAVILDNVEIIMGKLRMGTYQNL